MHVFTWSDQDWIRVVIFKKFADQGLIAFDSVGSGLDSD